MIIQPPLARERLSGGVGRVCALNRVLKIERQAAALFHRCYSKPTEVPASKEFSDRLPRDVLPQNSIDEV